MGLITTFVLAFLALLGIIYIFFSGMLFTVDGLFMSLILLTVSGICGTMGVYEIFKGNLSASGKTGAAAAAGAAVQRGRVQSVDFFESSVGQPNKSIVTLGDGKTTGMLGFEGDLRNGCPGGRKGGGTN